MRRVRALSSLFALSAVAVACTLSCATPPPPTSTTPATQGSAPILPSPSRAEQVPREESDVSPPPAEAAPQPSAAPSAAPSVKF